MVSVVADTDRRPSWLQVPSACIAVVSTTTNTFRDDAREYLFLVLRHALCWVHEGRHYKKLEPVTPPQQAALDAFQKDFWAYYRRLLAYRQQPSKQERARLRQDFDALFSRKTSYWALNERIALTKAKRERLLQVLEHPQVPLHTNLVERDIRAWGGQMQNQCRRTF